MSLSKPVSIVTEIYMVSAISSVNAMNTRWRTPTGTTFTTEDNMLTQK